MMLDTLVEELESYTDDSFLVAYLAVHVKAHYNLYLKGHIDKDALFRQIDTVLRSSVDRNNNNETNDKIKLDSFLYRFKEWLEQ